MRLLCTNPLLSLICIMISDLPNFSFPFSFSSTLNTGSLLRCLSQQTALIFASRISYRTTYQFKIQKPEHLARFSRVHFHMGSDFQCQQPLQVRSPLILLTIDASRHLDSQSSSNDMNPLMGLCLQIFATDLTSSSSSWSHNGLKACTRILLPLAAVTRE